MVEKSAREIEPFGSPSVQDVLADLDVDPLDTLTTAQRRVLAVIMSRVAERSYRRGAQQGATIALNRPGDLPASLHDWRYGEGADASPWLDGNATESSLGRLLAENGGLARIVPADSSMPTGTISLDDACTRLRSATAVLDRHWMDDGPERRAAQRRVIALGREFYAVGGGKFLSEVFDMVDERFGAQAVRGVSGLWTGIGEWSA